MMAYFVIMKQRLFCSVHCIDCLVHCTEHSATANCCAVQDICKTGGTDVLFSSLHSSERNSLQYLSKVLLPARLYSAKLSATVEMLTVPTAAQLSE